jgi:hypothetical protein
MFSLSFPTLILPFHTLIVPFPTVCFRDTFFCFHLTCFWFRFTRFGFRVQVEATLFALIMGIGNLAWSLSLTLLCFRVQVEATLFALIMGIGNLAWSLSTLLGVGIVAFLGSYEPEFPRLGTFLIIRAACQVMPLMLIPYLVPDGVLS